MTGVQTCALPISTSPAPNNNGGYNNSNNGRESSQINSNEDDEDGTNFEPAANTGITFDDVAGLNEVKDAVKNRILLPMQYPEYYKMVDLKAGGGILMYGLPGTGKTMIAKAIASEVGGAFYQIKCSDIVSKWFGEAEKNLQKLFSEARKQPKSVIFFDEFESIGAKRGGDSTVMNRIVPELLAQMQGFENNDSTLLIIAATNRPWDIDSALLRPGRFNDLLYVPLPDIEAREYLIGRKLKNIVLEGVTIHEIAQATECYNGSDCNELCDKIKMSVLHKLINVGSKEMMPITRSDYEQVIKSARSSVLQSDIVSLDEFEKNIKTKV